MIHIDGSQWCPEDGTLAVPNHPGPPGVTARSVGMHSVHADAPGRISVRYPTGGQRKTVQPQPRSVRHYDVRQPDTIVICAARRILLIYEINRVAPRPELTVNVYCLFGQVTIGSETSGRISRGEQGKAALAAATSISGVFKRRANRAAWRVHAPTETDDVRIISGV